MGRFQADTQGTRNGFGIQAFDFEKLQNGDPDGIALVNPSGQVIHFIAYDGGRFTAANGPAQGLVAEDIGVAEPTDTAIGHSLQLTGCGRAPGDFRWTGPEQGGMGVARSILSRRTCPALASGCGTFSRYAILWRAMFTRGNRSKKPLPFPSDGLGKGRGARGGGNLGRFRPGRASAPPVNAQLYYATDLVFCQWVVSLPWGGGKPP